MSISLFCTHLILTPALVFQVVVEKKLMRERKLTRHDIGRENFVSEVSTFPHDV